MQYAALVEGVVYAVEVEALGEGAGEARYRVTVDGAALEVDDGALGGAPGSLSLLCDGRAHAMHVAAGAAGQQQVHVDGARIDVEMLSLRRLRLRQARVAVAAADATAVVRAPMAGKVVAVLAREGETVEAGCGLVVVEAMKMENELRAPRAGRITGLTAVAGATVENGTALCTIA